jgi:hypothetical protein
MLPQEQSRAPRAYDVDRIALNELVRGSGLSFSENSKSWIFECPRCFKSKKLYIRKSDGRFVCWFCKEVDGFQGKPEFALKELLGLSVAILQKKLYGLESPQASLFLDIQLRDFFGEDDEVDGDADEIAEQVWPFDYYPIEHRHSARGLKYLEERGVSLAVAQFYGLRYSPPERRVIFPISSGGRLYGWQGRSIIPTSYEDEQGIVHETPKIVTTKGLKKENLLMFSDRLVGSPHAVLAEGPFDAIKAHLCGGNVATMGKAVSPAQVRLLRNSGIRRLYLGLDPDAAAEIMRLCREFSSDDIELFDLRATAEAGDLGAMSFEAVLGRFQEAPRFGLGRVIAHVEGDYDLLVRRIVRARQRRTR